MEVCGYGSLYIMVRVSLSFFHVLPASIFKMLFVAWSLHFMLAECWLKVVLLGGCRNIRYSYKQYFEHIHRDQRYSNSTIPPTSTIQSIIATTLKSFILAMKTFIAMGVLEASSTNDFREASDLLFSSVHIEVKWHS